MSSFVLIPGAWLGGWSWQAVTSRLRESGHTVYPLSLTGLGERVHLGGPQVNLDTHIADVTNLIRYEELDRVVLVGHSYAGIVVTGAADRVADRIAQVVYVDSGPAPNGATYLDLLPAEAQQRLRRTVAEIGEGWRLPMPAWDELGTTASLEGLDDEKRRQIRARAADQPFGTYTQPLRLTNASAKRLPKVLIASSIPLERVRQMIAAGHPWFRELGGPEWTLAALPTGHWPMFSRPRELAVMLNDLARAAREPLGASRG